jgi:hypothetical protein
MQQPKTKKRGRRPIGDRPMTPAERQRRRRAKIRRERQREAWNDFIAGLPTLEDLARDHPDLIREVTEEDMLG